jgi:hypothetical protein
LLKKIRLFWLLLLIPNKKRKQERNRKKNDKKSQKLEINKLLKKMIIFLKTHASFPDFLAKPLKYLIFLSSSLH